MLSLFQIHLRLCTLEIYRTVSGLTRWNYKNLVVVISKTKLPNYELVLIYFMSNNGTEVIGCLLIFSLTEQYPPIVSGNFSTFG